MKKRIFQNKNGYYISQNSSATRYVGVKQNNKERLPLLYNKKEYCCGCGACANVCPMVGKNDRIIKIHLKTSKINQTYRFEGAIAMLPDDEGFLYPVVDANICIGCQKCMKVCAFQERGEYND